jgi:5-methylcytosine-specific restriction endonuclease McrA
MGSRKTRDRCACGKATESNGIVNGKRTYKRICTACRDKRRKQIRELKKPQCKLCGFVAQWHGQLDLDHVDGNHHNNDPSNLQTLCANCHRLKTHRSRDHLNPGRVGTADPSLPSMGNPGLLDDPLHGRCACGNKLERGGKSCWSCRRYRHRRFPKDHCCAACGFVAEWAGQLDMDHIDGDRLNNVEENLQTLCANCHRLKTYVKRDHLKQDKPEPLRAKDAISSSVHMSFNNAGT